MGEGNGIRRVAIGLCAASVFQCGRGPDWSRDAEVAMTANALGTTADTIVFTITGGAPAIAAPKAESIRIGRGGIATGALDLPGGKDRTITAQALDSGHRVVSEGSVTVDVKPEMVATPIPMVSEGGQGPVSIQLGSYSVAITPPTAALTVGSSQRLEAGVTDASERPANVGASKLKWVTSDSTVVALTVDADHHGATATAVAPGQAQVSAACEGITAVAAIKVKGVQSTPPVSSPIATGEHSCAVVSGGARCWGNDELGQLGSAATQTCNGIPCSSVPVAVGGLSSGVTAIAVGREHTCVIANGGAQCFGANLFGELGDARIDSGGAAPVPVAGLSSGVTAIAAGDYHNCAIVNGGVQCWGQNLLGQLGTSLYTMSAAPVAVPGLMDVVAIAAGGEHTCAIANGAVTCWGLDANGELGSPTTEVCGGAPCSTVPLPVAGLSSGVTAVAAGVASTCAIVNGGVQCWGSNAHGELGDNAAGDSAEPVPVAGLSSGAMAIAAGIDHACAIVNGAVRCWGNDAHGELGDNGTSDSAVPVQVMGLSSGATAIAAGDYSTCALANGGIECWGANLFGQLGDASTDGSAVPRPVLLH